MNNLIIKVHNNYWSGSIRTPVEKRAIVRDSNGMWKKFRCVQSIDFEEVKSLLWFNNKLSDSWFLKSFHRTTIPEESLKIPHIIACTEPRPKPVITAIKPKFRILKKLYISPSLYFLPVSGSRRSRSERPWKRSRDDQKREEMKSQAPKRLDFPLYFISK
jgi:hypothetical protein